MEKENLDEKMVDGTKVKTLAAYSKPMVKKYPLIQQTTGYVIYYYAT